METEGWDQGRGSEDDGNVVRLQREWFGPKGGEWFGSPEDLVPVGPGVFGEASPDDEDDTAIGAVPDTDGSTEETRPVRAEHFWDGVADVHDLVQFPDDGSPVASDDAKTGLASERRRQRGWPRVAAVAAIMCCLLAGIRVVAGVTSTTAGRSAKVAGLTPGVVDRLDRPLHIRHMAVSDQTAQHRQNRATRRRHAAAARPTPSSAATSPVQRVSYSVSTQPTPPPATSNTGSGSGSSDSGTTPETSGGGGSNTGTTASHPGPTGRDAPFGPGHMGG